MDAYRQTLQTRHKAPAASTCPSQIDDRLEIARENYRHIVGQSAELAGSLSATTDCTKAFGDAKNQLAAVLPDVEARVRALPVSNTQHCLIAHVDGSHLTHTP